MTQSCFSSLRFNPLVFSSTNPSSSVSEPKNLSLHLRKVRKSSGNQKIFSVKAAYSNDYSAPVKSPREGIWSIRDDLRVPSSPYTPAPYAGQGPPAMVQERFSSVISQLFQYRIIRCGGPVEDDMANTIVAQLLYLDAVDPTKDIVMYVNSPGGSVTAGMAIFDTMKHIRPDVSTVCVGLAASMGAFILSAGTKGKRYSLPNSRIMIHQPLGGMQGQLTDIEVQIHTTQFTPQFSALVMGSVITISLNFSSLRMYNSLVERCFTDCVDTFRRKSLDKQEESCVRRCAEKFLKHSMRVGMRFAELNSGAPTQD